MNSEREKSPDFLNQNTLDHPAPPPVDLFSNHHRDEVMEALAACPELFKPTPEQIDRTRRKMIMAARKRFDELCGELKKEIND